MTIKKYFYIILTFLSVILTLDTKSQELPQWIQYPLCSSNSISNDGYKIKFLDINNGYVVTSYFANNTYNYQLLKTNNGGVNWTSVWSMQSEYFPCFTFDVVNANVMCIYCNNSIYMSWNGGQSWEKRLDFNILGLYSKKNSCVKFFNENVGYATYIPGNIYNSNYPTFYIIKTTDGGHNWFTIYQYKGNNNAPFIYEIEDMAFLDDSSENVKFVGRYFPTSNEHIGMGLIINYNHGNITTQTSTSPGTTNIKFTNIESLPNSGYRILRSEYNYTNSNFCKVTCYDGTNQYFIAENSNADNELVNGLSFINANTGYSYIYQNIYKTTNSGINWTSISGVIPYQLSHRNCLKGFGDMVYALNKDGIFITKTLFNSFYTNIDMQNLNYNGIIFVNNIQTNTPFSSYLRGGDYNFGVEKYFENNQKLFYKWENDNSSKFNYSNRIIYDNNLVSAAYKSKFISNTIKAISLIPTSVSTPSSTKAMRDTNAVVHQIHESLGGVFYSRSSDGGANFTSEETVNYSTLKNDADANRNSFINIIRDDSRNISGSNPFTLVDAENNVVACWERYNTASQRTEIMVSKREDDAMHISHEWHRYNNSGNNNESVEVFHSFPSNPDFQSYPKVFSVATRNNSGIVNSLEYFVTLVVHLEPYPNANSTTKRLVVTGKTGTMHRDYVIDEGNISDISVTAPINSRKIFSMHFAYIKDNEVQYKLVTLGADIITDGNLNFIDMVNGESTIISTSDGMQSRITPDISLRNNHPVITYRGYFVSNKYVEYPGNAEGTQLLSIYHYPVIVKARNALNWDSFITYDGSTQQEEPNIEGSLNANGYILNFKKNNAYFQFAKIDGYSGYYCNPGTFAGSDAKLVRKSYIGEFGASSNPMLLTLSQVTGSTYQVGKQSFSIINQINPIYQQDGFSNMGGTISKENIDYIMNLGPIFVSNTVQNNFNDDVPPQTVQSIVEFNETMKSSLFGLKDGDTLILGTNGRYITNNMNQFQPLSYRVNLYNYTEKKIEKELFKDTIRICDSISNEYLRGFVISGLNSQTDSFYVQMEVDSTANGGTIDYAMAGIYSLEESSIGDGLSSGGYKTKIFFDKNVFSGKQASVPDNYSLSQNYPNPFNPTTKIKFSLPENTSVKLRVFNILGKEVETLVNSRLNAGIYEITFNANNLSSGIYFYRLEAGSFTDIKKMVLLK